MVAGAGAMLFGFLIVYDTQQIFGSASASFGGGKRDLEYTLDMQLGVVFFGRNLRVKNFFLKGANVHLTDNGTSHVMIIISFQ